MGVSMLTFKLYEAAQEYDFYGMSLMHTLTLIRVNVTAGPA